MRITDRHTLPRNPPHTSVQAHTTLTVLSNIMQPCTHNKHAHMHIHTYNHTLHQWQTKTTVTGSDSCVRVESTNDLVEEAAAQVIVI